MVVLAADHGGYLLKEEVKKYLLEKGVDFLDVGAYSATSIDYPDIASIGCDKILNGECDKGLFFCGTGVGISISANKIKGIRACCCSDFFSAKYTRLHNDANILCLGGRVVGAGVAFELVDVFLNTAFEGGRHQTRIDKISQLEN